MTSRKSTNGFKTASVVGKRLYLRFPTIKDLEEVIALNRASVSLHHGLVSPPIQPEQFHGYLKSSRREDFRCFLACRIEDHAIVGTVNLSQIFMGGFQSAYLGYYVGEPFAGRGYMTEAVKLALRYAFKDLKLHRVEANIQPGNVASIALVKEQDLYRRGFQNTT